MKIFAVDDEKTGYENLVKAIQEATPDAELQAFHDPLKLLEYAKEHPGDVAFLDVEMGTRSGIEVAKQLKIWYPNINIIFVTGYDKYMAEAFAIRVSGYVGKPVTTEKIQEELKYLVHPVSQKLKYPDDTLVVKCFGNFDVFVNHKSLKFQYAKTLEMLAYLIDRRGNAVTSGELRTILWEDARTDINTGIYLQKLKKDLRTVLKEHNVEDVFVTSRNKYAIDPEKVYCDYYEYLENRPSGIHAYNGEYMSQYHWNSIEDVDRIDRGKF